MPDTSSLPAIQLEWKAARLEGWKADRLEGGLEGRKAGGLEGWRAGLFFGCFQVGRHRANAVRPSANDLFKLFKCPSV